MWEDCSILDDDRCWSDRNYVMFGALADVRNYIGIEHLPVRGIPSDVTIETLSRYGYEVADKREYDRQVSKATAEYWVEWLGSENIQFGKRTYCSDPDWHTPNWCTTSEMEDCINRVFRDENGGYQGAYIEWLALLGAMKAMRWEVRSVVQSFGLITDYMRNVNDKSNDG